MCDALGLDAVVWLPYGLALDDDTDGHVDNVACFTEPGTLLVQGCDDPTEDDCVRMDVNRRVAEGHPDAHGERIRDGRGAGPAVRRARRRPDGRART